MDIIDHVAAAPGPLAAALGPLAELLKIKWSCTKFIGGGGGGSKNRILGRTPIGF